MANTWENSDRLYFGGLQTVENSSRDGDTRLPDLHTDSWEICMQVKKQQLELDMEQQTGSKLEKEYIKDAEKQALMCFPALQSKWSFKRGNQFGSFRSGSGWAL